MSKNDYYYGLGRRKSSTAQVRVFSGKGDVTVNGKPGLDYFDGDAKQLQNLLKPLDLLEKTDQYSITAMVKGGGKAGQSGAIRLGISKAISTISDDIRSTLKRADLLVRDSREKERKRPGLKGARKQRQFTKR